MTASQKVISYSFMLEHCVNKRNRDVLLALKVNSIIEHIIPRTADFVTAILAQYTNNLQ